MNIKISKSEKGTNRGSAAQLGFYLDKENKGKAMGERKAFFSHDRERVSVHEAIRKLDGNKKNLGNKDAKFFLINISPSQKELEYIGNDEKKLKAYTRKVMDAYAQNFGKGLEGKDLMYFAKIEKERSYHGNDPEVKAGRARQGEKKPGLQTHIHVIVSRKDIQNKIKLSPLTKHRSSTQGVVKGGFDREAFVQKAEEIWDKEMNYSRSKGDSFSDRLFSKRKQRAFRSGPKQELHTPQPALSKGNFPLNRKEREHSSWRSPSAKVAGIGKLGSALKKGAGYELQYDGDLARIGMPLVQKPRKRQPQKNNNRELER